MILHHLLKGFQIYPGGNCEGKESIERKNENASAGGAHVYDCSPYDLGAVSLESLENTKLVYHGVSSIPILLRRFGYHETGSKTITRKEIRHSSPNTRVLSVREREREKEEVKSMICVFDSCEMEEESV